MVHVEGGRQPGVAYVAIVLFALLVAAMLIPGYTMGF
jgi:general stress protein CsbA